MENPDFRRYTERSSEVTTKILKIINISYSGWIFQNNFYSKFQSLFSSIITERFTPQKSKYYPGFNPESVIENVESYQVLFKPTVSLYRLIGWGLRVSPNYRIMMDAVDVATHDIALPVRDIIAFDIFHSFSSFQNENDALLYKRLIQTFLETRVFISADIINYKFFLVVLKQ
jgi:hypothetical protein